MNIQGTRIETVQWVFPRHANILGTLYGGRMMAWITENASLVASRVAKGPVILGSMDDVDFLSPVKVGHIVTLRGEVEYIGRSSMEVGVYVLREDPERGEISVATVAHLAYVAVDPLAKPREIGAKIEPQNKEELRIFESAKTRREARRKRLRERKKKAKEIVLPDPHLRYRFTYSRLVFPDDAYFGDVMYAGRLLLDLDQAAAVLARRFTKGPIVTASMDAMDFYSPIYVGNILNLHLAVQYVGNTSLEIGVRVLAEDPFTGDIRHTTTSYLTFVHMDETGHPRPIKSDFRPETDVEKTLWREAIKRKEKRRERVMELRERIERGIF